MEESHPFKHLFRLIKAYLLRIQGRTPADNPTTPAIPALPEDDLELDERVRAFPGEMFAQLLIELPDHRTIMAKAYKTGDLGQLSNSIHQLLGGAAYCDAQELCTGLRELRLALKTDNPETIEFYYLRAIDIIDSTLRYSGYRGPD